MTSSAEAIETVVTEIEPLPPALSSMWRLCKLGYRHEPRLMLVAFVLSQLAALPDALIALWLMVLGVGVVNHRPGLVTVAALGLGAVRGGDLVSAHDQHARAAPVSRQGHDCAGVSRRAASGIGSDDRASRTS